MEAALRAAARTEVRRRIDEADARLGKLGVEVDGIEIAIATEEERVAKEEAAKNQAAARAEAKSAATEEAA